MRRPKFLVLKKQTAHEIPNLRVSRLGAVVTHDVLITNDFSFYVPNSEKKRRINADIDSESVPQRLCRFPPISRGTSQPEKLASDPTRINEQS